MYTREYWKDHVVDQNGEVIQQGTLQDQAHFNNMETGIDAAYIASKIIMFKSIHDVGETDGEIEELEEGINDVNLSTRLMMFKTLQDDIATKPEIHTVDLEMGEDAWPFNNRETTVALDILRENICYGVDISVLGYSGGRLGSITVADRALNGFKLIHDGSASQVRVILRITGGMDEAANKQ